MAPLFEDDNMECDKVTKNISDSLVKDFDMHNVAGSSKDSYFSQHHDHEVESTTGK